jgi:hypothetical protein
VNISDLITSLPSAVSMYRLSLGVSHISDAMPVPVYAFLSGLNAATVGIIALAAVKLAEKAITSNGQTHPRASLPQQSRRNALHCFIVFPGSNAWSGTSHDDWDFQWLHFIFKPFLRGRQRSAREDEEVEQTAVLIERNVAPRRLEDDPERSLHHRGVTARDGHDIDLSQLETALVNAT